MKSQVNGINSGPIKQLLCALEKGAAREKHEKRGHEKRGQARFRKRKSNLTPFRGRVLAGTFPPKQLKLVQAWVELHRDDLFADWELAVNGEEPFRIAPLQ